jgi:hypothetical protein
MFQGKIHLEVLQEDNHAQHPKVLKKMLLSAGGAGSLLPG